MPSMKSSSMLVTNYFTCTLGEAVGRSVEDVTSLQTINDLIDHQARTYPQNIAVGFPVPGDRDDGWGFESFTFEDLRNISVATAKLVLSVARSEKQLSQPECVALLCPSSVDFLFTWLGLMRAGYSVLLVAPQCQPAAIAHLCRSCNVSILFHDSTYTELAKGAVSKMNSVLKAMELPRQARKSSMTDSNGNPRVPCDLSSQISMKSNDAAFIFHTSGTSTGLPKPIIQTHHAAFGVLPIFDGRQSATFSTTPLYHGGIADCLRAWTSAAPIWLFPAENVPITTRNVVLCLSAAAKAIPEASAAAQVKYFSGVPFVLQMLADDSSGVNLLKSMELVGVGGAALSPITGDYLVEQGVNLVSRFGSTECGFLLTSHRDFNEDKNWQYLRQPSQNKYLFFEKQDDDSGLSELIVKRGWPHMAKINRPDGSFATSDLFEPHPSIKEAWRYQSRSDSQITLSTGKKFDPAPLEDFIASSSSLIREVMVIGSDRQSPGALVILSKESLHQDPSAVENEVYKIIEDVNSQGQSHTRIGREKLVLLSVDQPPLERSAKGTLLRGPMEKKFASVIKWMYSNEAVPTSEHVESTIEDSQIKGMVSKIVIDTYGDGKFDDNVDFFALGVDSTMCARIRSRLQTKLIESDFVLPWNVVYDCGNIDRLTQYVIDVRNGNLDSKDDGQMEMLNLVETYSKLSNRKKPLKSDQKAKAEGNIVILTGATGALGAHLLDLLRKTSSISQVVCLVRAVDHHTARSRVSASLIKRRKASLEISDPKVWCSPCKLNDPNLGLSDMELSHIRQNTTHIIHAAWAVNFSIPLNSFVGEHITGIQNILNFSLSCSNTVHFTFCSSTASVLGQNYPLKIEERTSTATSDAGTTGYSRSKWVAEAICAAAAKNLPGTVNILRIGQLTGDTENGVWNISEAWPLMLSTVDALGCLPELEEPLSWLPLDVAAIAIIEIAFQKAHLDQKAHVFHLVNTSTETTWSDLLSWGRVARSESFDVVSPHMWLKNLEKLEKRHPAKNLLGLWQSAYGKDDRDKSPGSSSGKTSFSIKEAQKCSNAMQGVAPVDRDLGLKIWSWLEDEIRAAKANVYVSLNRFRVD